MATAVPGLEGFKLRIRKGNISDYTAKRGPVVARHHVMAFEPAGEVATKSIPILPNGPGVGVGENGRHRKNSTSIPRSRQSSPGSVSNRRPPSPGPLDPVTLEAVKNRVRRVQQARLYLLQQMGPNSFLVGGDSPEHKYRVVIGPQTCSCGRGPHCLHLLFVMLRVFQVPESDSRVYARELKNYEVESLFHNYQKRRNSRVNTSADVKRENGLLARGTEECEISSQYSAECSTAADTKPDEEELCPICLLEMVDGESLVVCAAGCHNKLHHHCMSIWAEECFQQTDSVLCPLCRHPWRNEGPSVLPEGYSRTPSALHTKKSPVMFVETTSVSSASSDCGLPVIPPEQMPFASEWIKVFGIDLVSCLYSRNWKAREMALRRLMNNIIASQHSEPQEQHQVLWCAAKVLAMVAADPIFEVYLGSVRCFRLLLSYLSSHTKHQQEEIQDLIRPIIKTLLLKCADRNRHTVHHSIEVLLEFSQGQNGKFSLGRNVPDNPSEGLEAMEFLLDCILQEGELETVNWQWLLGRLVILDHLFRKFSNEFWLQLMPLYQNESGYKLQNHNRLIRVVEFAFKALPSPHVKIAKLARQVFIASSSMTAKEKGVFNEVLDMLSSLDPSLQMRLKKRLHQAVFDMSEQMPHSRNTKTETQQGKISYASKQADVTCQRNAEMSAFLARPKDLPLDLSKAKCKKAFKFQQLPGISVQQVSSCKRWGSHGHKLLSLFTHRKMDELLPTNQEVNGVYRELGSPTSVNEIISPTYTEENCFTGMLINPDTLEVNGEKISPTSLSVNCQDSLLGSPTNLEVNGVKVELGCHTNMEVNCVNTALPSPMYPEVNGVHRGVDIELESPTSQKINDINIEVPSPTSPRINGVVRYPASPARQRFEYLSRLVTPTTPIAPHTTPVVDVHEERFLIGESVEVVIPFIPCLSSLLEKKIPASHSHNKNMESGNKFNSYLEGVDWKRGHVLGSGAFSTCFQARDMATGTLMAVKQIRYSENPEDETLTEARIREEICTMSTLRHENIVRILGATKQGNVFNLFVEWMPGGSIAGLLKKYGSFNEQVILHYTKQILEGLTYLHSNDILHRDLKGANLLVDSTGNHLRIADFGTAVRLASQKTIQGESRGQLLGTIAFMAPEVLRGYVYGCPCDIWSVGCCIIEMASSNPPWSENCVSNHLALMYKIASSPTPPSIPDTASLHVKDLAMQCLQLKSENRPSAKELLHHLCFEGWEEEY